MIEDETRVKNNTPLSIITEAFEDLADLLKPPREIGDDDDDSIDGLRLDAFCSACTHVSVLFNCLGFAFKFAEMEYLSKVQNPNFRFLIRILLESILIILLKIN